MEGGTNESFFEDITFSYHYYLNMNIIHSYCLHFEYTFESSSSYESHNDGEKKDDIKTS